MKTAKKLLLTSALAVSLLGGAHYAQAASDTVDATVTTRPAVTVTTNTDMSFGILDIDIANQAGDIVLTTAGAVDLSGATGVTAGAGSAPTAGQITIGTDAASPLDITCSATGVMKSGANTLNLSAVTIKKVSGTASLATDHVCTGSLEASLITPTAASVVVAMGATIAGIDTQLIATGLQHYTTVGNTPITFTAVYH